MMWSLIIIACVGTIDGAECQTAKWHQLTEAECRKLRIEERQKLAGQDMVWLVAKCERGIFG